MMTTAWRIPDPPLRMSVIATHAIGFGAVIGIALIAQSPLHLSSGFLLKAASVLLLICLLTLGFVKANHPFDRFGAGNQITTARATIVALVTGFVGEAPSATLATSAALAALIVTMLDGADGWTARRSRLASAFGARFDMEVDALLILTLSTLAWQHAKAGPWIIIAGLLRYAFVVAGWIAPWLQRPLARSRRRQAVCVVQIVGLSLVLLPVLEWPASAWGAGLVLATLVYSFAADVVGLWRDVD